MNTQSNGKRIRGDNTDLFGLDVNYSQLEDDHDEEVISKHVDNIIEQLGSCISRAPLNFNKVSLWLAKLSAYLGAT